jgi:hypothetical protein
LGFTRSPVGLGEPTSLLTMPRSLPAYRQIPFHLSVGHGDQHTRPDISIPPTRPLCVTPRTFMQPPRGRPDKDRCAHHPRTSLLAAPSISSPVLHLDSIPCFPRLHLPFPRQQTGRSMNGLSYPQIVPFPSALPSGSEVSQVSCYSLMSRTTKHTSRSTHIT